MLKKLGLITLCVVSAFAMHTAELNINDKDIELGVRVDAGQFTDAIEPEDILIGAKMLHVNDDVNDLDDLYELSFLMQKELEDSDFVLGLGIKINFTKRYTSIPLGFEGQYKLPLEKRFPVYITGALYFAPDVITMQDGIGYMEQRIAASVELIENTSIKIGYRSINTSYKKDKGGSINFNSSIYLGFEAAF